jgi:hypothetical protein
MVLESPALSNWDISNSHRCLDLTSGAMGRKADHGIPNPGASTAGFAGRV